MLATIDSLPAMGLLDRLRRGGNNAANTPQEKGAPLPAIVADEDVIEQARQAVLPGFMRRDDAVGRVREVLELAEGDPRPTVIVDRVWAQRKAEESTWSGTSDYDKLSAAFDDLQANGVVTRMNFACCNTCGTAEIDDERTPLQVDEGYGYREAAYTFFHEQDADRLAQTPTTLFLTYSAWQVDPDLDPALLEAARAGDSNARDEVYAMTDARVGEHIAAALRSHGLTVTWDGNPKQRIAVQISDWHKPLPA